MKLHESINKEEASPKGSIVRRAVNNCAKKEFGEQLYKSEVVARSGGFQVVCRGLRARYRQGV